MVKNFEQVKEALLPKLEEYLFEHHIDATHGNIICLNPNHKDSTPSMTLYKDHRLYCHGGCGVVADIFMVAHYLEGKPSSGPNWLPENFLYLAEKYEIPVELGEVSEEAAWKLQVYRAMADITHIITISPHSSEVTSEIKNRGWTADFCRKHNIGTIPSKESFKQTLLQIYSEDFLREIDIFNAKGEPQAIFSPTNLIYVVKDEYGRSIGFAARDLVWTKDKETPKYINSKTTGLRLNLYEKDRRLYGIDHYLKTRKNEDEPLYIVEGYPDWATMVFSGIHNCVAIGGTSFSDKHVSELIKLDIRSIILALDGDTAGQNKIAKLLDERLSDVQGINVSVVILPEGLDPDEVIRENGIEEFLKLKKHDAFSWRMMQYDDRSDPVDICNKLVPFIVAEPSYVRRETMIKELCKYTGVTLKAITQEVDRLQNIKNTESTLQRQSIISNIVRQLTKDPESAEVVLITGLNDIRNTGIEFSDSAFSAEAYFNALGAQKTKEETIEKQLGWKLGELSSFGQALAGDWEKDVVLVLGGKSNHGKSSYLAQLSLELATHNDDIIVLFLTIDDTADIFSNRYVTLLAHEYSAGADVQVTMNKIKNPTYFAKAANFNGEGGYVGEIRDKAYAALKNLVRDRKLVVKDQTAGATLAFTEALVRYYREKFPEKRIIFFLDNFHKLQDFKYIQEERVRFKQLIYVLKNEIAVRYHIPVICTMEYTKIGAKVKPSNNNLAESVALEYDANGIFHLYNELADYQSCGEENYCPTYYDIDGKKGPVIELIFGKNKISDFKSTLYYQFFPDQSRFEAVRAEIVHEWREQIAAKMPPMVQKRPGSYAYVSRNPGRENNEKETAKN